MTDDDKGPAKPPNGADRDFLSPELALVDPAAGEEARWALPGVSLTEDSVARKDGETRGEEQHGDAGVEQILELAHSANFRAIARRRRRFLRRMLVPLIVVLAAAAAVAIVRVAFHGKDKQASVAPGTSTVSVSPKTPATRAIPDFVWVPVKRAAHYLVEFRRGARVVHTATTRVPRLHVAAATLPPGRYRWRVWALDKSGARVGSALVDASVTIR